MTITQIAKMAGVSVSAVSRYLNDGYISEEKRKAIKEVIDKTGYQPSKQAQVLRTKRSKVIGVIVPKINSESVGTMVAGISKVLTEAGYQILLADTENNTDKELEYLHLLDKNPVDGIIFIATIFTAKHKTVLKKLQAPVVILGQQLDQYPCVFHDDYQSAKELTEYMLDTGKTKPGCLCVTEHDVAAGYNRKKGYLAALSERGIEQPDIRIEECSFKLESGYEKARILFEKYPDIDSLFCATDSIAIGAIEYLKETGRVIPENLAIAGIGHTRMSRVITPKLTTVNLHYKTSGSEAAKMLLELIENEDNLAKQLKIGYEIIRAESV